MLCPRCIGLHAGFFVSLVYSLTENHKRNHFSGIIPLTICISGILLILLEWSLSQLAITSSTSLSRLFTGVFAGSSMSILALVYTRNFIHGSAPGNKFTTVFVLGILCLSLAGVSVIILSKNWHLVTLVMVFIILFNLSFAVRAIFLRFKVSGFLNYRRS
jgi:hypothetical protein